MKTIPTGFETDGTDQALRLTGHPCLALVGATGRKRQSLTEGREIAAGGDADRNGAGGSHGVKRLPGEEFTELTLE